MKDIEGGMPRVIMNQSSIKSGGVTNSNPKPFIVESGREPWRLFSRRYWWVEYNRNLWEYEIVERSRWCSENCESQLWYFDSSTHRWFFDDQTDHVLFLTYFKGA